LPPPSRCMRPPMVGAMGSGRVSILTRPFPPPVGGLGDALSVGLLWYPRQVSTFKLGDSPVGTAALSPPPRSGTFLPFDFAFSPVQKTSPVSPHFALPRPGSLGPFSLPANIPLAALLPFPPLFSIGLPHLTTLCQSWLACRSPPLPLRARCLTRLRVNGCPPHADD